MEHNVLVLSGVFVVVGSDKAQSGFVLKRPEVLYRKLQQHFTSCFRVYACKGRPYFEKINIINAFLASIKSKIAFILRITGANTRIYRQGKRKLPSAQALLYSPIHSGK
jgi:hypothetical protein